MRDLKLHLEGQWWDSLLYKGQLHLFGMDGSLSVYAWEELISDLAESHGDAGLALRFAFAESNAIYRAELDRAQVRKCFAALESSEFEIGGNLLAHYRLSETDNDFPFPHATSAFHYDRMIVASSRGVHGAHYDPGTQDRTNAVRLSIIGANQAWPAYGNVAIAGGTDGLFQIDLKIKDRDWPREQAGDQLSERTCDACDWMYSNIIGMSFDEGSVLARFSQASRLGFPSPDPDTSGPSDDGEDAPETLRKPGPVDPLEELVGDKYDPAGFRPLTWGSRDKIYKVEGGKLAVFRLLSDGRTPFIGKVPLPADLENLVSVKTSLFGLVFEFDESLVVMTSDGRSRTIKGEPVNWRIFPRSRRYENHLHVLREDALEILSFNQDVEQNQYEKLIGTRAPVDWTN